MKMLHESLRAAALKNPAQRLRLWKPPLFEKSGQKLLLVTALVK